MNHVIALSPTDLAPAQQSLLGWCDGRIEHWKAETAEAQEAYEHAISHKWKSAPLKRVLDKAASKIKFYEKIRKAIEAGYLIVPNFPMEIFAIRTKRVSASGNHSTSKWQTFEQGAQALPEGDGEYKSPIPLKDSYTDTDKQGKAVTTYFPTNLAEEIEIPLHLVKPGIMRAVDKARAMRLFDCIGISTDRRGDPLVLGRISEKGGRYNKGKEVTFFLAWYVDLDAI